MVEMGKIIFLFFDFFIISSQKIFINLTIWTAIRFKNNMVEQFSTLIELNNNNNTYLIKTINYFLCSTVLSQDTIVWKVHSIYTSCIADRFLHCGLYGATSTEKSQWYFIFHLTWWVVNCIVSIVKLFLSADIVSLLLMYLLI